jgi:hypothetical protein
LALARFWAVPLGVRVYVAAAIGLSSLPPLLFALAELGLTSGAWRTAGGQPLALGTAALAALAGLTLAVERPRGWSARAYLAQLRARFELPQHPSAASARPTEEKP